MNAIIFICNTKQITYTGCEHLLNAFFNQRENSSMQKKQVANALLYQDD